MKPTALLAVAIFLACAPSPDSKTISEMSFGFLSQTKTEPLLADELASDRLVVTTLDNSQKNLGKPAN